jgi:quinol monooxygenase YgiN
MATAFVVTFKVKPDKGHDFEQAFRDMSQGVREHEPGNIYYELYAGQDPHTYVIIERYKDAAAVAAHGRSPHAQKLVATLRDLLDGPPQAQRLTFISSK